MKANKPLNTAPRWLIINGMNTIRFLILWVTIVSCATPNKSRIESKALQRINSLDQDSQNSINALIEMIEEQALVIDPDKKRLIPYEFRIQLDVRKMKQVHRIDSLVSFTVKTDAYQCIGENATKEKILHIVSLPYTYKIRFCPYE